VAQTADRLLRLLLLLQRRPSWGGPQLAAELGVDERTVRRDVERARALGYEVASAPGTGGGYRLTAASEMPPLLLDEQEAMAVAVLLGVSATMVVPGIEQATLATLARVDRLLPPRLQRQVKALRAATVHLVAPPEVVPAENLGRFAEACEAHLLVAFDYRARDGNASCRRAEPYRLVFTDRRWYLVAYDLDRADWRTFRVDRAAGVRVTGHTFAPRQLDDAGRLVANAIAAAPYRYQAEVKVYAGVEEVARRVPPHIGDCRAEDGHVLVRIGADELDWVAGYIVGLGFEFEAVAPGELREMLASLGRRLVRRHGA
jgi:predicted DNA-binding transcriptional regulator YafY